MLDQVLKTLFGSKHDRDVKRLRPRVEQINSLEPQFRELTDSELPSKTAEFKQRLANGEPLDDLIPEAFACCREAARRTVNMRHFDVQLMGGIVLHEGKIAEMATGEGKTLVATLSVYLNALEGKGVHVVTVNDYLARRDAAWMGPIYQALGISVGVIQHGVDDAARQAAYRSDVTYGTNNEFGFDYLRDNMKFDLASCVQRELHYAIVDEVDSILIDEARTPLIISGPAEESTDKYYKIDRIIPKLRRAATITEGKLHEIEAVKSGDYIVDEKAKTASLTEAGVSRCEQLVGVENLYDPQNIDILHHINQGLRAHTLFNRDVDYMVKDGEVVIVDEFTGRLMPGRRWSDGLHQAIEAKEGVRIERENQTLATITFQNYFRMFDKLAGMTGTADTEAAEFAKIYKLDVVVIPTNCPLIRTNYPDVIYKTEEEKFNAACDEIAQLYEIGRPVLVGTISIEKSEKLSRLLKKRGIPHQVLNAKYHEKEAEIVAQAGRYKSVTIATNMAGRGTDILLGGNPQSLAKEVLSKKGLESPTATPAQWQAAVAEAKRITDEEHKRVVELGGLHILGTERHESRRIDNQLRGRAGRQGDPGSSRFYLSLEDDLLRIFGSARIASIMDKLGMEEGEPIEHRLVTRAVETAQKRVETHNFEIRKQLLEYDDVMNTQRGVVYQQRREILEGEDLRETIQEWMEERLDGLLDTYAPGDAHPEDWDFKGLAEILYSQFDVKVGLGPKDLEQLSQDALRGQLLEAVQARYAKREEELGPEMMRHLERAIALQVFDTQWKDHLLSMDHLKEGIGLRGYGQKDPLTEYKREGFDLFSEMIERVKVGTLEYLFKVQLVREEAPRLHSPWGGAEEGRGRVVSGAGNGRQETRRIGAKVGRNDPCPCGSGKKYKKCCLLKAG